MNKNIIEDEEEEEIEIVSPNRQRALKAWETMRKRGHINKGINRSYNRIKKNNIRDKIIKLISNYPFKKEEMTYTDDGDEENPVEKTISILTLETKEFLLANAMKKHQFYVAENNKKEYLAMIETKPENVFLHYGNISELGGLISNPDVIYLDFCGGFEKEKDVIEKLLNKIDYAKLIGFTFCLRKNTKELGDYKFDLINKCQNLIGTHWNIIFGESYSDKKQPPMVTLFFENKLISDDTPIDTSQKFKIFAEDTMGHFIRRVHEMDKQIWSPHQVFEQSHNSCYFTGEKAEALVKKIFFEMIISKEFPIPLITTNNREKDRWYSRQTIYSHHYLDFYNSWDSLFDLFSQFIWERIWRVWDTSWKTTGFISDDARNLERYWSVEYEHYKLLPLIGDKIEQCSTCHKNRACVISQEGNFCKFCMRDGNWSGLYNPIKKNNKSDYKLKIGNHEVEFIENYINDEIKLETEKRMHQTLIDIKQKYKYYLTQDDKEKGFIKFRDYLELKINGGKSQ